MRISLLFLAILISFVLSGCTNQQKQQEVYDGPVFDIAMQGVNPAWFKRAMDGVDYGIHRLERYKNMAPDTSALFRNSLEQMDLYKVRMGLLSHGVYKEAYLDKQPERFLLSYEPDLSLKDHTEAALEFEKGILEGKYVALGELGLVYEGIPLNTPALFPYYEVALKHDIPILIHTGFSGPNPQQVLSPVFRIQTANPLLLEDVIIKYPDLKIVMMHMGWPFYDEALYMLSTYPNVYMETSVAVWLLGDHLFHRLLSEAVATSGSDKILFGTLQMAWPDVIGESVTTIQEASYLTKDDKQAIFWDNAATLFEIE